MFGSPALRRLVWLKLRGTTRKKLCQLLTLRGAVFTLLGGLLLGVAVGVTALGHALGAAPPAPSGDLEAKAGVAALALTLLSLSGAFAHRGLFLPREEIERLFTAPVSRQDIVRYRIWVNAGRSLLGGALLGLLAMRRAPVPLFALCTILLGMLTLPVFHQCLAILLGQVERGLARRLRTLGTVVFATCLGLVFLLVFHALTGDRHSFPILEPISSGLLSRGDLLEHPVVRTATAPFRPWAAAIAAESLAEFLPWIAACVAILLVGMELTVRLPIDFRELSLETAASVAARLRRVRRGGGAAAGRVSRRTSGWSIPWVFGRGAVGAVAWRKTGAILRKARGTFTVSVVVLTFVTLLSTWFRLGEEDAVAGPLLIGVLGTLYLCAGLRFDFRDELDRMETIKAWPVTPQRLFLGTLLPEVFFVSLILCLAVLVRILLGGVFHPVGVAVVLLLPLVVFGWVALDNAVFLFLPVRFVPGQEGALQNAGRGMLLMLLRLFLLAVGTLFGYVAFNLAAIVALTYEWPELVGFLVGLAAVASTILVFDGLLVLLGGWALSRFDVGSL